MNTLFADPERAGTAPIEVVRLLEGYGYSREKTKKWSADRAYSTLARCQRDDAVVARRAAALAATQDDALVPRGQPSQLEREVAAKYLAETQDIDDLTGALSCVVCVMTDDETRRMAGYLIRLFRGEHAQPLATAGAGGGMRLPGDGDGREADADEIPE